MQITIRKFGKADIENKVKWINDLNNNQYLHYNLPLEYKKTLEWYLANVSNNNRYDAVIEADGVAVGIIGLLEIDYKNLKAEYYITLGEQNYKGKGISYKASLLLLEYAFFELKINKVYLYTEVDNIPAQRLFEKVGFKKEGLLKEDLIYNGRKVDRFFYGITANEYSCPIDNS